MFEVGFMELLLISVLALIVLGPERLPKVAAQVGRWVGRARAMARQFREQLEEEASLEPAPRRAQTETPSANTYTPYTPPSSGETSTPEAPSPDVPPPEVAAGADAEQQAHHQTQHHFSPATEESPAPASASQESPAVTAHAEPPHERGT
jgi:sec-independent protein translocase protein TatB